MNLDAQQHIDCRGQQCPQPILTTAKAARVLQQAGGGVLEIAADDGAFPLDLRSWCRTSGSELINMSSEPEGVYRARVRVPSKGTKSISPIRSPLAARETVPIASKPTAAGAKVLDCRGLQCPQPILQVAKRARTQGNGSFEVLADDSAFRVDLDSWSRSSGNRVQWLEQGDVSKARVHISAPTATVPRPQQIPTVSNPKSPNRAPTKPVDEEAVALEVTLTHLDDQQRIGRLQAISANLSPGERVRIRCKGTSFTMPLLRWATESGHEVLLFDARTETLMELRAGRTGSTLPTTIASSEALQVIKTENRCTLLVLHNDKEALLAALLVAVGAAAQGMDVLMFFTFWGLNLLRGDEPNTTQPKEDVSWMQRMMKWMMPKGPRRQRLGQMDMGGVGRGMLKSIMDNKNIMDVPELMDAAEEQDVQFMACTMSMQVMGITKRELAPRKNIVYGGVAAFVESAGKSNLSLMF